MVWMFFFFFFFSFSWFSSVISGFGQSFYFLSQERKLSHTVLALYVLCGCLTLLPLVIAWFGTVADSTDNNKAAEGKSLDAISYACLSSSGWRWHHKNIISNQLWWTLTSSRSSGCFIEQFDARQNQVDLSVLLFFLASSNHILLSLQPFNWWTRQKLVFEFSVTRQLTFWTQLGAAICILHHQEVTFSSEEKVGEGFWQETESQHWHVHLTKPDWALRSRSKLGSKSLCQQADERPRQDKPIIWTSARSRPPHGQESVEKKNVTLESESPLWEGESGCFPTRIVER